MSKFLEKEAEESSSSDSDAGSAADKEEVPPKKRKTVDSSEDSDEDESDNEEELQKVREGFIVDDEEEEEDKGDANEDEKSDSEMSLLSDDLNLIEENTGIRRKKKTRKVGVVSDDEEDGEGEGDEASQEAGPPKAVDKSAAIRHQIFGSDEEGDEDERPEEAAGPSHQAADSLRRDAASSASSEPEEEEDVNDFIVDDTGAPQRRRRPLHANKALQRAQEIFGVDFDRDEFEQYGGESADDDEEDEEDEEDEDEELSDEERTVRDRRRKKVRRRQRSPKAPEEIFDPSELQRYFITKEDGDIRATDLPERFQTMRQVPIRPADNEELQEEAEWIYQNFFSNRSISNQTIAGEEAYEHTLARRRPETVTKIFAALALMRNKFYEVPFIAFYRKEYVEKELNINDLWKVWLADEKWTQLRHRRRQLHALLAKMQKYKVECEFSSSSQSELPDTYRPLSDEDVERALKVTSLEELDDVYNHFLLYYGRDMQRMHEFFAKKEAEASGAEVKKQSTHWKKLANRMTNYRFCQDAKLDGLARRWGLAPEQFAENLKEQFSRHDVDQCLLDPLEAAKEFVSPRFPNAEDALEAARFMVATQIACDPTVRQIVRRRFFTNAKLTVRPTKKGYKEIDESHPLYPYKYITNKEVESIQGDTFLRIHQAAKDGLLTFDLHLDEKQTKQHRAEVFTYSSEVKQYFYRDEYSALARAWNAQRFQALDYSLEKLLYPALRRQLEGRLLQEARDGIVRFCCLKVNSWIKYAPYPAAPDPRRREAGRDSRRETLAKVMAVCYSTDREIAAYASVVSCDGEVLDFLRLPFLLASKRSQRDETVKNKMRELHLVKKLVAKHSPDVVAVGTESKEALAVYEELKELTQELVNEGLLTSISVHLVDNEPSRVYEKSKRAEKEFPNYPEILRQSVSVARRLQDPLFELAGLVNADEDVLCLRMHPLQDLVPKDSLLSHITLEFVNRVNEVGVDVNRCLELPNYACSLQFVCGLGPRKAADIVHKLKHSNQKLLNRVPQMLEVLKMGPVVFINCAGFIRIDTSDIENEASDAQTDILDSTRVHPESYELAKKIAVDAVDADDTAEDEEAAKSALLEVMEHSDRLKELDIDAFAEELKRQEYGEKHITLYDIRNELCEPYKDLRAEYAPPNDEEKFNLVTRETPETFYIGKLVDCTVSGFARRRPKPEQLDNANPIRNEATGHWVCPFCGLDTFVEVNEVWAHFDGQSCEGEPIGVRVQLDNGVSGFIATRQLSDRTVNSPTERVSAGQHLFARIMKIDIQRFRVDLTCRGSDLRDDAHKWKPPRDICYDEDAEENDARAEEAKMKQTRPTYVKRVIDHPNFHNVTYRDCAKLMQTLDLGEAVFRPSSKGPDHLTLSWKVEEGVVQHVDVLERDKQNDFSLGKTLVIEGEEFEDLDEVIARYVQPMASHIRDIVGYKYYTRDEPPRAEASLRQLKEARPSTIPYSLAASATLPGKFQIAYLPSRSVRREYITVRPSGLRYRGHMFRSLSQLLAWFKRHYKDPPPGAGSRHHRSSATASATPGSTRVEASPAGGMA